MIRSPLGLRPNPDSTQSIREQLREAATLGARGVVLDAAGDLGPDRLSETGRRELIHLLRSIDLSLIALHLPTRRAFDSEDQLDVRLARAERAFGLAYELGTRLILARVGALPPESDAPRREVFTTALRELGRRADHRGVRFAIETGPEPGEVLRTVLDTLDQPTLAASLDPGALLRHGHDPSAAAVALGHWVQHAYATDATGPSRSALVAHPRGFGFPPGALDWEEYLGSLEEIGYRGFLTIWPDPARPAGPQFTALAERFRRS